MVLTSAASGFALLALFLYTVCPNDTIEPSGNRTPPNAAVIRTATGMDFGMRITDDPKTVLILHDDFVLSPEKIFSASKVLLPNTTLYSSPEILSQTESENIVNDPEADDEQREGLQWSPMSTRIPA